MEMKISKLIEIFKDIQEKEGDIVLDCNLKVIRSVKVNDLKVFRSLEVKGTFEAYPGELKKLMELFNEGE
jgi:hypothetical protein